ncbi:MAG: TonB-dependent receptor [Methylobacteriaceae bacterium]|jgi:vitamin B12 transporter|nr:TonB-dependent receptor [Methylobacteriaceae bacterium]
MKRLSVFSAILVAGAQPFCAASAEEAGVLDTVVVTANRAEEARREVSSNVTVISGEEIRESSAQNLADILNRKGFVVTNQGTQKTVQIRGIAQRSMGTEMTSELLVLLNGRRIGANNVALMGLANIDHIEIIRGPAAVQFGPSAMGGVINVITKRGTEQVEASVETGIGSYGLHKEIVSISGAQNGFDFSVGLSENGRKDYQISGGKTWKHTAVDSLLSGNIDFGYTFLEKHRIGLNFNYYGMHNGESPADGWAGTGAVGFNSDYNLYDLTNTNLALTYDGATADDRFKWNARYSGGSDVSDGRHFSSAWGNSSDKNTLKNQSFAAQVGYDDKMFALTAGLDYVKYDYERRGSWTSDESRMEDFGGYLSAKVRLFDEKLILSAAGRFDTFNVSLGSVSKEYTDHNLAPSVGIAYLPVDWLKLRAHYAEGFRMPGPDEVIGSNYYVANYDLRPEKSKTFEVGADVAWNFIDAGLTFFRTDFEDKIVAVPLGLWLYQHENVDGARVSGIELALKADLGKAFNREFELSPFVNLNYLTERKNLDADLISAVGSDVLPDTPRTTVTYGLKFKHPGWGFTANVQARYFSAVLNRDFRAASPTYYQYVEGGDTTVVDVSFEQEIYKYKDKGVLSIRGEVNNLFDNDNEFYLDYPEPGRNFYASLRYNMKF